MASILGSAVVGAPSDNMNPAPISITVPSGTDAVWLFVTSWDGELTTTITLNGNTPDFLQRRTGGSSRANVAGWYNPASGARDLDLEWTGSPLGDGPIALVVYVAGFEDTPVDWYVNGSLNSTGSLSDTLTTASGDYVFAGYSQYGTGVPALISGWTSLQTEASKSDEHGRLSYIVATGSTQYVETGTLSYPKLATIALRPSSSTPKGRLLSGSSSGDFSAVARTSYLNGVLQ